MSIDNCDSELFTNWLADYPVEIAIELGNAFIESMQEDLVSLKEEHPVIPLHKVLHKIKSGLAMINFPFLYQRALEIEALEKGKGELTPDNFNCFIAQLEHSIDCVAQWIEQHR